MKMCRRLRYYIILISSTSVLAKEPELPLCPANFQFLPQQLPMHCRLPSGPHPMPPAPFPPFFPGPNPDRPQEHSQAVPMPPIPSFPPMPSGFPPGAPPGFPPGIPPGFPPGSMPSGMPMPMPMPMPGAPPSAKLPVIVMPFYSPDPSYKQAPAPNLRPRPNKRRIRKWRESSSTETDTDTSSSNTDSSDSDIGWWRKRNRWSGRRTMERHRRRRHKKSREGRITPLLQYVNKDGYVIYEKKISEGEAKGWLGPSSKQKDDEGAMALEVTDLGKVKSQEEEEVPIVTTQAAPQETPVVQIKIKKKTVKRRHHKPNRLIEQPVTTQEEHSH